MAVYSELVVGTDGSATANEAVQRAACWAGALDASMIIATVFSRPSEAEAGPPSERAGPESWVQSGYRAAAEIAQDAAGLARAVAPGVALDTVTPEGDPADRLLAEVERRPGSLLVVGSQGMTGSQRFLLGSVPNKVSHHASSDVLILRTGEGREVRVPQRMLLTTDGSETALRALRRGLEIAAATGAEATVLTVESDDERGQRILDPALELAQELGVRAHGERRSGDAADQIVAAEAGYDVVVMGNRGMTGVGRFRLGNVPNKVSHHSSIDLLIVVTA